LHRLPGPGVHAAHRGGAPPRPLRHARGPDAARLLRDPANTRLRKRPSTSELIDWIAVLKQAGIAEVKLEKELPFLGALLKKEQDMAALADQLAGGKKYRS